MADGKDIPTSELPEPPKPDSTNGGFTDAQKHDMKQVFIDAMKEYAQDAKQLGDEDFDRKVRDSLARMGGPSLG